MLFMIIRAGGSLVCLSPLPRARRKVHDRGFAAVMTSMIFLSQSIFYAQMPFHAVKSAALLKDTSLACK